MSVAVDEARNADNLICPHCGPASSITSAPWTMCRPKSTTGSMGYARICARRWYQGAGRTPTPALPRKRRGRKESPPPARGGRENTSPLPLAGEGWVGVVPRPLSVDRVGDVLHLPGHLRAAFLHRAAFRVDLLAGREASSIVSKYPLSSSTNSPCGKMYGLFVTIASSTCSPTSIGSMPPVIADVRPRPCRRHCARRGYRSPAVMARVRVRPGHSTETPILCGPSARQRIHHAANGEFRGWRKSRRSPGPGSCRPSTRCS